MKQGIIKLQDINRYRMVAETMTEENRTLKQQVTDLDNQVSELTASIEPFRKMPEELRRLFLDLDDRIEEEEKH